MSEDRWEFVRSSKRQRAYIRRKPWCRAHPTVHQRKVRYFFGKISHDSTGQTGLVKHGDKDIPVVAHQVSEGLKGRRFAPPKAPRAPEILERFKPMFEEIGNQVASMKPVNRDVIPRLILWQRLEEQRKKKEELKKKVAA